MSVEEAKGERGKWIFRDGELIPYKKQNLSKPAPFIQTDERDPFENPLTGEMETSMSAYKRKLRDHRSEDAPNGYFIKGNERLKYTPPSRDKRFREIKEDVMEAERQVKYGMAKSTSEEREIWDSKTEAEQQLKMEKMQKEMERKNMS